MNAQGRLLLCLVWIAALAWLAVSLSDMRALARATAATAAGARLGHVATASPIRETARAGRLRPGDTEPLIERAQLLLLAERPRAAEAVIEDAVRQEPRNARARALLPGTDHSLRRELDGSAGLASASVVGAAAGFAAWALWRPLLGYDGATYHLSAVVRWVQTGSTGSVQDLIVGLPVGNYPLTHETGLAWAVGISQSFAPVAAWAAGFVLLLGASAWLGLGGAGVSRPMRVLTIVAVCLTPFVLRQLVEAETDFPAVAWLAAATALATAAQRRPALIGVSILAAALGVETKTTVAPIAAVVVLLGLLALRPQLRSLVKPIAFGLAAGAVVGGVWYLRNLAEHGSPLWPLISAPWGDPVPPLIRDVGHSLLERPQATFRAGVDNLYRDSVAGGLVLIAAALTAPLWGRTRATILGAAITLLALLAWASAPFTGAPD